jgi:Cdc6-like AAA superfamily ATPase
MASRLAERLDGARHSNFVGRTEERALFESTLTSHATAELPFHVLYVFGPAGVGKTALLVEFAHIAEQAHVPAFYIDARHVEPSPECFVDALQTAMNLAPPASPLQAIASRLKRTVILIDTYETLMPLDGWLRTVFLPELPQTVLVVLAPIRRRRAGAPTSAGRHSFALCRCATLPRVKARTI